MDDFLRTGPSGHWRSACFGLRTMVTSPLRSPPTRSRFDITDDGAPEEGLHNSRRAHWSTGPDPCRPSGRVYRPRHLLCADLCSVGALRFLLLRERLPRALPGAPAGCEHGTASRASQGGSAVSCVSSRCSLHRGRSRSCGHASSSFPSGPSARRS